LAAFEHMRFTTRQRIEGPYTGRHESRQQGGAGEFVDFREYAAGEDLRRLDWKVLGRTGRSYVRLYQDETNLRCVLAIDASGSMTFGGERPGRGGSKLEYVQYLASALAHLIARGRDQVGLATVADGLTQFLPPGSAPTHIAHLHAELERLTTRPTTNLATALESLFQRLGRRGVLLIMSDFLVDDLQPVFAAVRLFRHRRWEVVLLHVVHPEEERLPEGAAFRFEGLEGEGLVDCSPADIRTLYRDRFESHAAMVRALALATGCDYRRVSTAVPYLQTLSGFLVERSG
jgi:uncharacterized protein (DUF58 family)